MEPNGTTIEVINENTYLVKEENKFSYAWTLSSESTGIHRLIYAMYDSTEMLLVSGAKSFDVGKAVILGLATDKVEYTTITEPVDAKVSLYGKENAEGILTIYIDGNYINSQNIVWTGSTEELIISIPVVQAGWHTIKAELNAQGLISSKEVQFAYGSSLPDLAISASDVTIEYPNEEFENTELNITAKVYNYGKTDARNVSVRFYDGNPEEGGLYIAEGSIDLIGKNGGEVIVRVEWNPSQTGAHSIYVEVNQIIQYRV